MLKFEPLCWIYHDTWKWKQTKIIYTPTGEADLSKEYTHPGHIHLFFDGKDVSKMTSTKAYTGTQDYHFNLQDVWGPNSKDPNQMHSYRMIGSPIWYVYVEQYWRRMYVQSWDYDLDIQNGIHDGKGGIKYDASKPQHTLGPFREGAELYFFNTKVNRTLPIEYYLDSKKSARQLYVKDGSDSETSGGQIWHFTRQGELYDWMADVWTKNLSYWYFVWWYEPDNFDGYYPQKTYTTNYKIIKQKAQEFFSKIGEAQHHNYYTTEDGDTKYITTLQDCYGTGIDMQSDYSNANDERHSPQWDYGYQGTKKTYRIYNNDGRCFNGMNAKRIHKDGQNLLSNNEVLWQAYSPVFENEQWYKFITEETWDRTRWDALVHFYTKAEFENWKNAFDAWERNKLTYRSVIDYGDALYAEDTSGEEPTKVQDNWAQSNAYPFEFTWTVNSNSIVTSTHADITNTWYEILGEIQPLFPKYQYSVPVPMPQDYKSTYDTAFDNQWLGYYEYYEVVKYKNKYYRRVWKPRNYEAMNFGKDAETGKTVMMLNNVITPEIINQKHIHHTNSGYNYQYSLARRRNFPNPPPDGLPYDESSEHDMFWEYMQYFGKTNGKIQKTAYDESSYNIYTAPHINLQTLTYLTPTWNNGRQRYDYPDNSHQKWFEEYRVLWGKIKYDKVDSSRFTSAQIEQWRELQSPDYRELIPYNEVSIPYSLWNDGEKQACFNQYLNILHQQIIQAGYNGGYYYYTGAFFAFEQAFRYNDGESWHFRYQTNQFKDFTLEEVVMSDGRPTYLQFHEFCNIWQELTEDEVARLNLKGDMPEELENIYPPSDSRSAQACFNPNNPLDPFNFSNSQSHSAFDAWLRRYTRRQIYTLPEDTYCKGDINVGQGLHPYYSSYSEQDGARRLYPDDKFISPIIEYQKIIHKNWQLYNPHSYDILNDPSNKWRHCKAQEISTDPLNIDISIPFVNTQGHVISPFSETQSSPTLPIGSYSSHNVISPEHQMRYHVQWFDTLAQVKKYNLPQYIRLVTLYNNTHEDQIATDFISNTPPNITDEVKQWFYLQSNSDQNPYFSNSQDAQENAIHTPLIPVLRRNDEDTHVKLPFDLHFKYQTEKYDSNSEQLVNISNSCSTSYVYRAPVTQLCITQDQIAKSDDNTPGYTDSKGKIRQGGNVVTFNDPYGVNDGRWVEQCLGAIVKAKAVIILQDGLGHRWLEEVTTTELDSDTPLRGSDY